MKCKKCGDEAMGEASQSGFCENCYHESDAFRKKVSRLKRDFNLEESAYDSRSGVLTGLDGSSKEQEDQEMLLFGVKALKLSPVKIHRQGKLPVTLFTHESMKKTLNSSTHFISDELSEAEKIVFEFPKEHQQRATGPNAPELRIQVDTSPLPQLLDKLGPYKEISATIEKQLNAELDLERVVKLFRGAIIQARNPILILTCEVYGRKATQDVHMEKSLESLPVDQDKLYIGILKQSDSGAMKNKLIIGSMSFNILVTSSVVLNNNLVVNTGPEFDITATYIDSTRLWCREMEIDAFLSDTPNEEDLDISSLRQVTTGFTDHSTFATFRSTLSYFNNVLLMPSTVFTYCDTPANDNYGAAADSSTNMASFFLNGVASCQLADGLIDVDFMDGFFTAWDALPKDKKSSTAFANLNFAVNTLYRKRKNTMMSVLEFAKNAKLSKVADDAASKLSVANQKIAKNIHTRLRTLYK